MSHHCNCYNSPTDNEFINFQIFLYTYSSHGIANDNKFNQKKRLTNI